MTSEESLFSGIVAPRKILALGETATLDEVKTAYRKPAEDGWLEGKL